MFCCSSALDSASTDRPSMLCLAIPLALRIDRSFRELAKWERLMSLSLLASGRLRVSLERLISEEACWLLKDCDLRCRDVFRGGLTGFIGLRLL